MSDPDLMHLDSQLCFAIYSTAHAFQRLYKPMLDRLGLTYPQYITLLTLWERDNVSVKALGERLLLDSGTLTPLLKRLEAAGLVERRRNPDDERQVNIRITAKGRALRTEACAIPPQIGAVVGNEPTRPARLMKDLLALRQELIAATGS